MEVIKYALRLSVDKPEIFKSAPIKFRGEQLLLFEFCHVTINVILVILHNLMNLSQQLDRT
jgi:hypothetical protein